MIFEDFFFLQAFGSGLEVSLSEFSFLFGIRNIEVYTFHMHDPLIIWSSALVLALIISPVKRNKRKRTHTCTCIYVVSK